MIRPRMAVWKRRVSRSYDVFLDVGVSLLPLWLFAWVFVYLLVAWLLSL